MTFDEAMSRLKDPGASPYAPIWIAAMVERKG
jgi:hypothetical protein